MRFILAILLAALTGFLGWYVGVNSNQATSTNGTDSGNAVIAQTASRITGLGKIEPASGIIKILAPQGQKIESLFNLQVGDRVEFDQPIAQLAQRQARELELNIAEAKKQDALNQLELERSQAKLKKSSAQVAVDLANNAVETVAAKSEQISLLQMQLNAASQQLARLKRIEANPLTTNMVGEAELLKQEMVIEQLRAKIADAKLESENAARQAHGAQTAAGNDLQTVNMMIDNADKAVPMSTLEAAIDAAQTALDRTRLRAPISGTVLDIVVRPGDSVTNQPVMVIGDTEDIVCVCEINDVNFRFVRVGQSATISSVALEHDLTGQVISKGVMIGPPSMKDPNPFASVDRKTGRVVIALDDDQAASHWINLQVEVEIEIEDVDVNLN